MPHEVFISYSSRDKETADAVCATLEAHDIGCWIAPRDITPGSDWSASIIKALTQTRLFVLIYSEHSNVSPQVKREVERVVNKGIPILPLRIQDVPLSEHMEYFISTSHWLDALTPPLEPHLERLASAAQALLSMEMLTEDGADHKLAEMEETSAPPQPSTPNNLPQMVSSFIGREKQLAELTALISKGGTARLVTLVGAGGTGKTRLGVELASRLLTQYPDGVWFVELAPLTDPALVPQTVAAAVGVHEEAGRPLIRLLTDWAMAKCILLVLDNCEHLLVASAQLAAALLEHTPNLHILASSREALGITGETVYRVPTLELPEAHRNHTAAGLQGVESVRLFVDRACTAQPAFALTDTNAKAIADLCIHLDGIPLALELAAARVRALPVEKIDERLNDRFKILTGGSRAALPRQQTLRATIDWSYDLLEAEEKRLLARLAVFAGGWTLEAAEQVGVGGEVEDWEILDLLTALVDKSLVIFEEDANDNGRYRLLESVRQYAHDKLEEEGEVATFRTRQRDYFRAFVEEIEPKMNSAEAPAWFNRLEQEHDNLRAALDFSLEDPQGGEAGLRLIKVLYRFWDSHGYLNEGRRREEAALAHHGAQEPTVVRANALCACGYTCWDQGDLAMARKYSEEGLAIARALGDKQCIGWALSTIGQVTMAEGDAPTARACYEESLALRREIGDIWGITMTQTYLGVAFKAMGEIDRAHTCFEESLELAKKIGDGQSYGFNIYNLAGVATDQGDYPHALELYREVLQISLQLGHRLAIAHLLKSFADVALGLKQFQRAARLFGASSAIHEASGSQIFPYVREAYERNLATLKAELGEEAFPVEWSAGHQLTMEQAATYALETTAS